MVANPVTEKTSVAVTYAASAVGTVAGLSFNEWVALASLVLGLGTFAINWYYKHKTYLLNKKLKGIKNYEDRH